MEYHSPHSPFESSLSTPKPLGQAPLAASPHTATAGDPVHVAAAPAEPKSGPMKTGALYSKLAWLLVMLLFLSVVMFVGPHVAERYQYSMTRGKQRAKYEVAAVALKDKPLEKLSWASQMVSQRVTPSVVDISTSSGEEPVDEDEDAERPRFPRRRRAQGQGSGVIVDKEGYIVTNYHVIRGSGSLRVTLSDGRTDMPVRVVGYDRLTDIAVLKINADKLIAAEWGDSDELEVGSLVWAAGSPFGLERTFTFGILSAKHRAGKAGTPFQDYLQSDAAVNPGNSGGPLVDAQGRVVGINTAIVGETYQGVCFAIPTSVARDIYEKIKADGRVVRGWLGVALNEMTPSRAKELGLTEAKGVEVSSLVENGPSPARRAGVRPGDVIVRFNGQATDTRNDLIRLVGSTSVDTRVPLVVIREGKKVTLQVTIGRRPTALN